MEVKLTSKKNSDTDTIAEEMSLEYSVTERVECPGLL